MKKSELVSEVFNIYDVVNVLSRKNGGEIIRLRHKELGNELVLRNYSAVILPYCKLKGVVCCNLPTVFDTAEFEDGQIVFEEFIDGVTTAEVLEQGNYTYRGAIRIITGICNALLTLRDFNIVHRDIKPENIMVTKNGGVKLIDLNAARIYCDEKQKDTVILGTVGYAPPEQYGISQSDEKSDIYSLGVLLNVMLTGAHPSRRLAKGKAGRIVLKCTQIDPNSRFRSIEELVMKL